jgi:hypothetical protein
MRWVMSEWVTSGADHLKMGLLSERNEVGYE